jgi:hypothetical protein
MARRQRVDLRLDPGLVEWADSYARERASTRTEVIEAGLRSLREDAGRSVPDLEPRKVEVEPRRPVAPDVPGVTRASDLLAGHSPWRERCPSCGGRAFPHGGFQHKQTCRDYGRV